MSFPCKVCNTQSHPFFCNSRTFYKCSHCSLIFTNDIAAYELQKKHYQDQWEEQNKDFWRENTDTLLYVAQKYHTPKKILDFGSGSGGLTEELLKRGLDVTPLEPIIHGYLKDQNYSEKFNVVAAIEVVEHLPNLWEELREIEKVMTNDGIIIFTTLLTNQFIDTPQEKESFKNWWYKDDPTHINFFCNKTLEKLADLGKYDIDICGNNVFVVRKI